MNGKSKRGESDRKERSAAESLLRRKSLKVRPGADALKILKILKSRRIRETVIFMQSGKVSKKRRCASRVGPRERFF